MRAFKYKLLDIATGEYVYYCFERSDVAGFIDVLVHVSQYTPEPRHFDEYEIQEIT